MTTDFYQDILSRIDAKEPFALLTVLKATGSTPRKAGTKAIVTSDGKIIGTIGGGLLESRAQQLAVAAIASSQPTLFDLPFTGASAAGDDPVCGGMMRILIDPTPSAHRDAYGQAVQSLNQRRRGLLITTISTDQSPDVSLRWFNGCERLVDASGKVSQAIDVAAGTQAATCFIDPCNRIQGLVELLTPNPLLLIAGGGHVGQALARHASLVGFDVVLIEDRPEYADPALHPGIATRCGEFAQLIDDYPINSDTFIAIVGRGHRVDSAALAACIGKPAGYVGMMGSRRKIALVRKDFLDSGHSTAEEFNRVHAPIGLDIGAQTVPEVAASIVAELIAVRRTHSAKPQMNTADS